MGLTSAGRGTTPIALPDFLAIIFKLSSVGLAARSLCSGPWAYAALASSVAVTSNVPKGLGSVASLALDSGFWIRPKNGAGYKKIDNVEGSDLRRYILPVSRKLDLPCLNLHPTRSFQEQLLFFFLTVRQHTSSSTTRFSAMSLPKMSGVRFRFGVLAQSNPPRRSQYRQGPERDASS